MVELMEQRLLLSTVDWNTDASGFWDVASNWSTGHVPGPGDDVVFNRAGASPTVTIRTAVQTVNSLTDADPLVINNGGGLTLATDSTISGDFTLNTVSTLITNGTLTLSGSSNWQSGAIEGSGEVAISGTLTVALAGGLADGLFTKIVDTGTIAQTTSENVRLALAGEIDIASGGLYDFQADSSISYGGPGSPPGVFNSGTLRKSAGTGATEIANVPFNNTGGTIDLRTGTLDFGSGSAGGSSTGGVLDVAAGATLELANIGTVTGTYTGAGSGTVQLSAGSIAVGAAGATFNLPDPLFQWRGGVIDGPGTLTSAGSLSVLDAPGGGVSVKVVSQQGTLLNTGTMNWNFTGTPSGNLLGDLGNNGQIVNQGTVNWLLGTVGQDVRNNGTINIIGTGNLGVGSLGDLANAGTVNQSAQSTFTLANVFTNLQSGVYDIQGDSSFAGAGGFFYNNGTLRKSAGTGTSTIPDGLAVFHYGGTIDVESGTLNLQDSNIASTGGVFNVAAGAILDLSGGSQNCLNGTYKGSGEGFVQVESGRLLFGIFNSSLGAPNSATFDLTGGGFRWLGGTLQGDNNGSQFTNEGLFAIAPGASKSLVLASVVNAGMIEVTDPADLSSVSPLTNQPGGVIDFPTDGAVTGLFDLDNQGLLRKSAGTGTTSLPISLLSNTGTIEADAGTFAISAQAGVTQVTGSETNLNGGTWNALNGATLELPSYLAITQSAGTITLGAGSTVTGITALSDNSGTFSLGDGASFTTADPLTNSGDLAIGTGATLSVAGSFTQTSTGTLSVVLGGPSAGGDFGRLAVAGPANLDGTLQASLEGSFEPTATDSFTIVTFASHSGDFASDLLPNNASFNLAASITSTAELLSVTATQSDLAASNVTAPQVVAEGIPFTVTYQVTDSGGATDVSSWVDSIYLAVGTALDPSAVLLGRVTHTGALAAGASYTGSVTASVVGVPQGTYHVIVLTDSRGQVADTNRANNLSSSGPVSAVFQTLEFGTTTSGTIAAGQSLYFEVDVPLMANEDVQVARKSRNRRRRAVVLERDRRAQRQHVRSERYRPDYDQPRRRSHERRRAILRAFAGNTRRRRRYGVYALRAQARAQPDELRSLASIQFRHRNSPDFRHRAASVRKRQPCESSRQERRARRSHLRQRESNRCQHRSQRHHAWLLFFEGIGGRQQCAVRSAVPGHRRASRAVDSEYLGNVWFPFRTTVERRRCLSEHRRRRPPRAAAHCHEFCKRGDAAVARRRISDRQLDDPGNQRRRPGRPAAARREGAGRFPGRHVYRQRHRARSSARLRDR